MEFIAINLYFQTNSTESKNSFRTLVLCTVYCVVSMWIFCFLYISFNLCHTTHDDTLHIWKKCVEVRIFYWYLSPERVNHNLRKPWPSQQNQIFSVISHDSKWFFKPLNIAEYSDIQSIVIIFGSKYLVFVFRLSLKTRKGYYTVYYVLFR